MLLSELIRLHKLSSNHREMVLNSSIVSCFYCISRIVPHEEIKEWIDGGQTALCPLCGIDSVIPADPKLTDLAEMKVHYFGNENSTEYSMSDGSGRRVTKNVEIHEDDQLTLGELQQTAHANSAAKGFWDEDASRNIGEKLMLVTSELSEALEEYRKGKALDLVYFKDGKPEGFGVELADAVIRIADLAEYAKIDLTSLIRLKQRFNESRPFRHGKKV